MNDRTDYLYLAKEPFNMVSPSNNWDESDSGFEKDGVMVTVEEMKSEAFRGKEGGQTVYTVALWEGRGYDRLTEIASYEEPQKSWELVHLITRFVDEWSLPEFKMGAGEPFPGMLTDKDPEDLIRDSLGYNDFKLDEVLPEQ